MKDREIKADSIQITDKSAADSAWILRVVIDIGFRRTKALYRPPPRAHRSPGGAVGGENVPESNKKGLVSDMPIRINRIYGLHCPIPDRPSVTTFANFDPDNLQLQNPERVNNVKSPYLNARFDIHGGHQNDTFTDDGYDTPISVSRST